MRLSRTAVITILVLSDCLIFASMSFAVVMGKSATMKLTTAAKVPCK